MTIAANVLSVPSNWSGGSVGNGFIYSGHNDGTPNILAASTNDSDGYYGTGNTSPSNQRRTLTLTNGEVIWDFAGNVGEFVAGTITGAQPNSGGVYISAEYTAITNWGNLPASSRPSAIGASSWNSSQGIGKIDSYSGETRTMAFIRGCGWDNGMDAGVLCLALVYDTNNDRESTTGFRVTQSP